MTDLTRVPRGTLSGDGRIVLPSWLTPAFAKQKLRRGGLANKPRRGEKFSQVVRYRAIVQRRDWDAERDWALVWQEPRKETGGE
jgi:hypothetical protein